MADQSLGASEPTALEHAIEQLYAVPLADFMTTRAVLVAFFDDALPAIIDRAEEQDLTPSDAPE